MVALTYLLYFSNIHLGFEAVPYYLFLYIFRFNRRIITRLFNIQYLSRIQYIMSSFVGLHRKFRQ